MESLALFVLNFFLGLIALSLVTVVFSIITRARGKFRRTSIILFSISTVVTIWVATLTWRLGAIPFIATLLSGLLLFLPKRSK